MQASGERGPSHERLLLAAMQTSPDAFVVLDDEDRVEWWNRGAEQLFGWPVDEAAGRLLTDLVVPEQYRAAHHDGLRRRAAGGAPRLGTDPVQVEAVCRDGRRIIIELTVGELTWEGGRRFHAFIRDVTQRESTRTALELSEKNARTVFAHAPVGMLLTEVEGGGFGRVVSANAAVEQMLGYSQDELRLMSCRDITHPDDVDVDSSMERRLLSGAVDRLQYEKRYLRRDGNEVWVTFGATVVRDVDGSPLRSIHQLVDISERVAAERELERLNGELREANDLLATVNTDLDRFAAAVAHDLQSPLTAILMHAELLVESLGAHTSSRGARSISHAARRLNSLIEGLLLYARAQGAELHRREVELDSLVDDAAAELAVAAGGPVRITREDLPTLSVEPRLFRQVVANVLDNGLKYVAAGETPHVHVTAEHDDGAGTWTLHFADRGIGLPPEARERVFEVFHRESPDYPGTGIGLATSRRIVERHGGRIWIEPGATGGSVVCVRLPAGESRGTTAVPHPPGA